MGALAWASVPFYDWFCRVTGFGGVTNTADTGSDEILDQTITVRFDASKERSIAALLDVPTVLVASEYTNPPTAPTAAPIPDKASPAPSAAMPLL